MRQIPSLVFNQIADAIRHKLQDDGINCCNDNELDAFEEYVKELLIKHLHHLIKNG